MRNTFIHTLTELAGQDERIVLLTGDLGFMVMEPFMERFPDRFINVGVAEQNMVGLSTGLAEAGLIPFVYSIAPFASLRPFEFIRNGPVFHQLPVRVVAVGMGFEYGHAGPSHHAVEDVGVMRTLRGLSVVAPADFEQAKSALLQTWQNPGPVYFSLGKNDKVKVVGLEGRYETGRVQMARQGQDVLFLSMGSVALDVSAACDALQAQGIAAGHGVVASLSPAPEEDLLALCRAYRIVITVEAHVRAGGLGSLVGEVLAAHAGTCRWIPRWVEGSCTGPIGGQSFYHRLHGLDGESLVATALMALKEQA